MRCFNGFISAVRAVIDTTPALPSCNHETTSPPRKKVIIESCTAFFQCLFFAKYAQKKCFNQNKTAVGKDEVMLSLLACCLDFNVCYKRQILSYLFPVTQTCLYPDMLPCTSCLDCYLLTLYPESHTAGETSTNVFQADLTLTAL